MLVGCHLFYPAAFGFIDRTLHGTSLSPREVTGVVLNPGAVLSLEPLYRYLGIIF